MAWLLLNPEGKMTKELRCEDIFRDCPYVSVGSDIRELMREYMEHVRDVHRVTSPTPELRIQAMVAVRERQTQVD
jgi:predicted small metal-binding protein